MSLTPRLVPGLAALALGACTSSITPQPGGEGVGPQATPATGSTAGSGASASTTASTTGGTTTGSGATGAGGTGGVTVPESEVALAEFTRLTRAEYRNTTEAAFAQTASLNLIPEDGRVGPFTSNFEVTPDPVHPYLLAAEDLAELVVGTTLPACEVDELDSCFDEQYQPVLQTLFRRPLGDAERATWTGIFEAVAAAGATPVEATRAMLAAALVSPDFLYRAGASNAAEGANLRRLAERLSYALWDAPPDADLFAAAVDGPGLIAEAQRLSGDARATLVFARFVGQWLGVDTDLRAEDPEFSNSPDYLELLGFVQDAVENDVSVLDFIAGTRGFVHEDNRTLYGLGDADTAGEVTPTTWSVESGRRGLLAQELFASSTRHPDASRRPIFRGLLVREALLCEEIPTPDAELVALADEVGDRTEDSRCSGCHLHLDPIGRVFAAFDPDHEGEVLPAEILIHDELQGSYADAAELLEGVGRSRSFAECFARHFLGFFLEQPLDAIDTEWTNTLADNVQAGASLASLVEQTMSELHARSQNLVPWCDGE